MHRWVIINLHQIFDHLSYVVECFSKSEVLFPGFKRKPGLHVCDDVVIVFLKLFFMR